MKREDYVKLLNDIAGVMTLSHQVKKTIEGTADGSITEEQARALLGLMIDVKNAVLWVDLELTKELRDATSRRHEAEEGQ